MPEYRLPYGKTSLTLTLPDDRPIEFMAPRDIAPVPDPAATVEQALNQMVGDVRLDDWTNARSVAIAIADKTRPLPHAALYPLLAQLESMNLSPDAITLLIATGTHTPMTPDEFGKVLPDDILARYPVISHNCDDDTDMIFCGDTPRGTPVWVNRRFHNADLRIVVGNLGPHQFMGFSGGVKSAAIGLAGRTTINTNHAMMRDPEARLGHYDNNPARQDVEDIGRLMGVHVALNLILNREKQIVRAIAGDPVAVMRAGIPMVRQLTEVLVSDRLDLVIASPGGYPKDINLYQAQKALAHASLVLREGGTVIVVAACGEGTGSLGYDQWMAGMMSYDAVLERFAREAFQLGPHKAYQICRDARRARVVLISEMVDERVRQLLLTPAQDLDVAVHHALDELPLDARIGVMPVANATVPVLAQNL